MAMYNEIIANSNKFLTNFATSYKLLEPVADFIAPPFRVKLTSEKYAVYNKSVFRIFDDHISGDERPKTVQYDIDEASYTCEEYSMGKWVSDRKKTNSVAPIQYDKDAVKFLKQFHSLSREYRINQIAGNAAIITQTANALAAWAGAAGTPMTDILLAISVIKAATGVRPNSILIPDQTALRMIQTTEWQAYFGGFDASFKEGSTFSAIKGLRHIGLDAQLSSTHGVNTSKGTSSDPETELMWDDSVLIFHRQPAPTLETRTFMFSPYVAMNIITTTRKPRRRGVYHDIYSDIDELLVDAQCAYLITNTI